MKMTKLMSCVAATTLLATLQQGEVSAEVPRPEHPCPDACRLDWTTLNGEWQFEIDQEGDGAERGLTSGKDLAMKITVLFCPESKLNGIGHYGLMTGAGQPPIPPVHQFVPGHWRWGGCSRLGPHAR